MESEHQRTVLLPLPVGGRHSSSIIPGTNLAWDVRTLRVPSLLGEDFGDLRATVLEQEFALDELRRETADEEEPRQKSQLQAFIG